MIASLSLRTTPRALPSRRARASVLKPRARLDSVAVGSRGPLRLDRAKPGLTYRSMATPKTARTAGGRSRVTHAAARGAVRTATRRREAVAWETRTFATSAAAILAGFILAVVYLGQITGVSAHDYEMQRLGAQRSELRRTAALLDIQLAKLDSPARIEAQALRLGLIRVGHVPVMDVQELAARK